MAEEALYTEKATSAIALGLAPYPFDCHSSKTVRVEDVPLVKQWYLEHCLKGQPIKVLVS